MMWNAYLKSSQKSRAQRSWKDTLHRLHEDGLPADAFTYASLLRICGNLKSLSDGRRVHQHIITFKQERDNFLGSLLVQMYAKCGILEDSRNAFVNLHERNIFSWNCLIGAYARHRQGKQSINLFEQMQAEAVIPDRVTFVNMLSASAGEVALSVGRHLHARLISNGLDCDVVLGTALVNIYGKVGSLGDAHRVFDNIIERNVVCWTAMIAVYSQHGHSREPLQLFDRMLEEAVLPNHVTFVNILSACTCPTILNEGKCIHARIVSNGLEVQSSFGNALVNMYGKCGSLTDAQIAFDKISKEDLVSWNVMIAVYVHHGHYGEAISLFNKMQQEKVIPDRVTFLTILSACASQAALTDGKYIHYCVICMGLESDVAVLNALVNMYGKCGSFDVAHKMVKNMHNRNIVSWNALIAGYAQHGHGEQTLPVFHQMLQEGIIPNTITFVSMLDALHNQEVLAEGKRLHTRITFKPDVAVATALVNMYGKCGSLEYANTTFHRMNERNVVSWNTLIVVYNLHGHSKEALDIFDKMQAEGMVPDKFTFANAISACANESALAKGKQIHALVICRGFTRDVVVDTALVNMYGKCGSLEDAQRMFRKVPKRDVILWSNIINLYAQHGQGKEALGFFDEMQQDGVVPNEVTYVSILSACSHAGLINEGRRFLSSMEKDHGITPTEEHYDCVIDLLGRLGQLDEAEEMINKMPFQATYVSWMTLLGACRNQIDIERGERIAKRLFELYPENTSPYIMLSHIYAAAGREDDAKKVLSEMMMKEPQSRRTAVQ